ncbi:MAG TPA: cysteine desulfurase-like protein [Anaerolineae bacterium]|nr:cysteine desulfurase-like protein [Anaerolineae bacterium]HID83878.1 cysteine desulfurase-like protein [Anaerolineales bacterium]HIQ08931.1 cysteine desulfurase-like protein [Anaerolineaceae bacterium]
MTLSPHIVREQFPALERPAIFFDAPGGTQVPQQVLKRMTAYYTRHNANHGGAFATSRESDAVLDEARAAMAAFLNAARPEEIVFGPNMTTLTLHLSRSLAHGIAPGDRIVVTRLDHDANISPWLLVARDRGAEVLWVDFDPETGLLDLKSYARALEQKPRLVAFGYASNALGTVNPVREMVSMAKAVGALTFVDAVQYAPHGTIDVQTLGCDFLVCSTYKFFGPHLGVLYGRYDLLAELPAYKVRPAPEAPPGKWETGTQNHEGIAGALGALEYLAWVGQTFGSEHPERFAHLPEPQRHLRLGMAVIQAYEQKLSRALLEIFAQVPGLHLYGPRSLDQLTQRVPTFSFTLEGWHPQRLAEALDRARIYTWDGNFYALAVTQRLGVEEKGGLLRVGAVHYNTLEEVYRLGEVLQRLARAGDQG